MIQRDRRRGYVVLSERALYALLCVAGVTTIIAIAVSLYSAKVVSQIDANAASIEQFCLIANRERGQLEQQQKDTATYLNSPAGREPTGLNQYIRTVSVPQLQTRIKTETVPPVCVGLSAR